MSKNAAKHGVNNQSAALPLDALRNQWAECWGMQPHAHISRSILVQSLTYRQRELVGGGFSAAQAARLEQLKKAYRRNSKYFDDAAYRIKSGTRLVRTWRGAKHSVLVIEGEFQYQGKTYTSLSEIAFQITNTRWNGWIFFGLKKAATV